MKNREQGIKLERKPVSGIVLTAFLIGMLTLAFNVQPVSASGTTSIRADGSVDPPTASTAVSSVPGTMKVSTDTTEGNSTKQFPEPSLEWRWDWSSLPPNFFPNSNQVMMTPIVADVTGPNDVPDFYPDIIFSTFKPGTDYTKNGIIRVIDGRNGAHHYSIVDPDHSVIPIANIAVADLDQDGNPEIIAIRDDPLTTGDYPLICFNGEDGSLQKESDVGVPLSYITDKCAGPAIADIDHDGQPEIIVGNYVFDRDCNLLYWLLCGPGRYLSCVANLNRSDNSEVIGGNSVDGDLYWYRDDLPDGYNAIADFNSMGLGDPEVVLVGWDEPSNITFVWVLDELTGATLCSCSVDTFNAFATGGPPCIEDFDGDGIPEIGVAMRDKYVVIDVIQGFPWECTIMWSRTIQDLTSGMASSSAFDFDQDGKKDIVYSDECSLYIFDGGGGIHWEKDSVPSYTAAEMPVIADVDYDEFVEIVVPLSNCRALEYCDYDTSNTGIEVYGNDAEWPCARRIWNQHTYHITNIDDDLTVPDFETYNWDTYNNYRAQLQVPYVGPVQGDANGDGVINSADVVYLINYLFKNGPAPDPLWVGDCNCDGVVNSADVVYLINYLFKGGPPPGCE